MLRLFSECGKTMTDGFPFGSDHWEVGMFSRPCCGVWIEDVSQSAYLGKSMKGFPDYAVLPIPEILDQKFLTMPV